MFEKFGNMDYDELIRTAAAELAEGDEEAIIALAQENGLEKEDAEDYIDGLMDILCTPAMAAIAKIELEAKELKLDGAWQDWKGILLEMATQDKELAIGIRKKDKNLVSAMAEILKLGFQAKSQVDKKICKAAGLREDIYIGIPTKKQIMDCIEGYYKR